MVHLKIQPPGNSEMNRTIGNHPFLWGSMLNCVRGVHMDVSKNSGTPKSSTSIGFSIINHPFWGYPYFWKHPYRLKFFGFVFGLNSLFAPTNKKPRKAPTSSGSSGSEVITLFAVNPISPVGWGWEVVWCFFFRWAMKKGPLVGWVI